MKRASVCTAQSAIAIVASVSKNGWNRCRRVATALAFWDCGNRNSSLSMRWLKAGSGVKATSLFMDWVAQKAALTLEQTGRFTVIVQDNSSIHKRELVRQHWQKWQDQGLLLFFLPPYSAEMNRIEDQWHQLKAHEIAGQMFADEYDLALAVIKGMEIRSEAGGYWLERFMFNST